MHSAYQRTKTAVIILAVFVCCPAGASAWQILSALTEPCHEHFSLSALPGVEGTAFPGNLSGIVRSALFPPAGIPEDPVVSGVAELVGQELGVIFDSYETRLAAMSLFVGSRYPDIMEGSAYDFFVMRPLMLSDSHEDSHCLRRTWDDGPDGDVAAVAAARALIWSEIAVALESARGPLADRFVPHTVHVDFYGEVELDLYEPLVRLGRALHTFEDSFSHTLRSDDLVSILSVLNAIDAVSDHFDERRDGLAHSMAMDRCLSDAAGVAVVCAEAVRDLVGAVSVSVDPMMEPGIDAVLDHWMTVVPGCTFENDYCQGVWLEIVRRDPYEPFIPMFLGCGFTQTGNPWILLLLLIPFCAMVTRRNR